MHMSSNRSGDAWNRRDWLIAAARLGTACGLGTLPSGRVWSAPSFADDPFTLGVASGDPLPTSVVLWTRLAPDPLAGGGMPARAVDVRWEVAGDEAMRRPVRQGTTRAFAELGHAVHVEPEGLEPGTEYWYRFTVGNARSPIARTRTAPAHDSSPERFRFGVCGCSHYEQGLFTAYRHMAEERFDAIFHTGDYIYEYGADERSTKAVRRHLGAETFTLDDYRRRYAQYKLDPDLQAAHASAPFIVTWDDHEVDNDWASDYTETRTPPEIFRLRRAAAFQAYYEAMPLRRSAFPGVDHLQLYRQIRFGDLLSINALDTRQYRSFPVCRYTNAPDCAELTDSNRSLLGHRQEAWLDERLSRSRTHWNVLAQQVPLFGRDSREPGSNPHAMDKWPGYPASRERLLRSIEAKGLRNVVLLSGDVHSHWAADIPRELNDPTGAKLAVEFTSTSITSGGNGSEIADYWPSMQADHPHVRHHSNRRGYLACEVTPERWQTDFRELDQIRRPGGRVSRSVRVVVEQGNPMIHVT